MIRKINTIKNMAVFKDFQWNSPLKEFGHINIIYGRNYSGKTTLSRIIRALETGDISDKYGTPQFSIRVNDSQEINQFNPRNHDFTVRVFNEDFIKDHLSFINNEEGTINSFAILGENNTRIENQINELESKLGDEEDITSLRGRAASSRNTLSTLQNELRTIDTRTDASLRSKANDEDTGIKHNKVFGDPNYNIKKIKADAERILESQYKALSDEERRIHHNLLQENAKPHIPELKPFNFRFGEFARKANNFITQKIQLSSPITELLEDAFLNNWVREGHKLHKDKRKNCAFCGNTLPADLSDKLDKHFNNESETLDKNIDTLINEIENELTRIPSLLHITLSQFYSEFHEELEILKQKFNIFTNNHTDSLNNLKNQLTNRKNNLFTPLPFTEPNSYEDDFSEIYGQYDDIRVQSNNQTESLSERQSNAREQLRLNEVNSTLITINYKKELENADKIRKDIKKAEDDKGKAQAEVLMTEQQIAALKSQMKDESKGADQVNAYLNSFFGHRFITLKPIKCDDEQESAEYRFEITRSDQKAYNLSEGERRLIAFCYFMAKLHDIDTKDTKPIIWIDDPICSLDSNHIFFIYSLINTQILKTHNFQQVFISTHNLEFLKFLKQFTGKYTDENRQKVKYLRRHYTTSRLVDNSTIEEMPNYMKNYVTEFNYLFKQIYDCSIIDTPDDSNYSVYYNFANNARKFLEMYLYYKYPNQESHEKKMTKLFGGDNIPILLTDRLNNEYSHLCGTFERGSLPIEVSEMKSVAKLILDKLQSDEDQYQALLESIGVHDEEATDA